MPKPVITLRGLVLAQAVLPLMPSVIQKGSGATTRRADTGAQDNEAPAASPLARAAGD